MEFEQIKHKTMKIVVSKTNLEKAVKNICQVINKKCALPILGDIHFKCQQGNSGNYMDVMGSDSEVWLCYNLTLEELSEDGEFCVDATMLKNALANLPEQPLELIVQPVGDVANMAINHQTGHTIIPVESADEYPKPIAIDEDNLPCLSATCSVLKRAMKRSVYALGNYPLHPVMECMYFDKKDEQLNIVASNGHVLIKNVEKPEWMKNQQNVSFAMPKKAVNILLTIMGDLLADDDLYFAVDERQVKMDSDNIMLQFCTPEAKYPNYDSVIPSEQPYFARGDRQSMVQAIKNVSPFANSSSNMVVMRLQTLAEDPDGDTLEFIGEDVDFSTSATDRIHVHDNYVEDFIQIGMKASSLIDSLGRLVEHEVEIQFADPSRAVTIRPLNPINKDEEITMLIMPMIIGESEK